MARKFQFRLRTLLILIAVFAVVLTLWRHVYFHKEEYRVVTFSCGKNREIIITTDPSVATSSHFYYRVVIDGKTVIPPRFICFTQLSEKPQFKLMTAEKGELAGVFLVSDDRDILVVLHDFNMCESWPALKYDSSELLKQEWFFDTLKRLRAENPNMRLVIGDFGSSAVQSPSSNF